MKCLSRVVMCVIALSAVMVSCNLDPIECPDKTNCNGVCADLQEDNANCGTCGNVCKEGEKCKNGECKLSCSAPSVNCGTTCANIKIDINHCGECGHVCDDGEKCDGGKCVISCGSGQIECNGGCVDTKIDINHCGECGHACQEGEKCDAGVCVISCPESQTVCENHCFNLNESEEHCGSCEIACNSGELCIDGACKCQTDFEYCNSKCVNLSKLKMVNCSDCEAGYLDCDDNRENGCELFFNVENCGSCGHKCKNGEFCSNGTCVLSCQDGEIECDGKCINLSGSMNMMDCSTCKEGYCDADNNLNNGCEVNINGSDIENCGSCGNKCEVANATNFCVEGKCNIKCDSGYHEYDGVCEEDSVNHCGKHDYKCGEIENGKFVCKDGVCVATCNFGYKSSDNACVTACDSEDLWCPQKMRCCSKPGCVSPCHIPLKDFGTIVMSPIQNPGGSGIK